MAAPLTDIHVQHILSLGLKTIRSNPKKHLADIFGDAKLDPHAALYGQNMINQIEKWIMETKIPVVLGFDLSTSELPAVTVVLSSSHPDAKFIGDDSIPGAEPLDWQQYETLVPSFIPQNIILADDQQTMSFTAPDSLTFEQKEMIIPGLLIRDKKGRQYTISRDGDCNPIILNDKPLTEIDLTGWEIVSPVVQARYSRGAMTYKDTVTVVVHGHQSRQEGVWLYNIVMWTLLKFKPVLSGTFGIDLSAPTASDFARDDEYAGEQVWRRYITMDCITLWTWESARQKDVLGLLMGIDYQRAEISEKK